MIRAALFVAIISVASVFIIVAVLRLSGFSSWLGRWLEARRKHKERLAAIERATDLVALISMDMELAKQVRDALNKELLAKPDNVYLSDINR